MSDLFKNNIVGFPMRRLICVMLENIFSIDFQAVAAAAGVAAMQPVRTVGTRAECFTQGPRSTWAESRGRCTPSAGVPVDLTN